MDDPVPVFLTEPVHPSLKRLQRVAEPASFRLELIEALLVGGHEFLPERNLALERFQFVLRGLRGGGRLLEATLLLLNLLL